MFNLFSFWLLVNSYYSCRKSSRRYGCIECDPLVQKGLEKSVSDLFIIFLF